MFVASPVSCCSDVQRRILATYANCSVGFWSRPFWRLIARLAMEVSFAKETKFVVECSLSRNLPNEGMDQGSDVARCWSKTLCFVLEISEKRADRFSSYLMVYPHLHEPHRSVSLRLGIKPKVTRCGECQYYRKILFTTDFCCHHEKTDSRSNLNNTISPTKWDTESSSTLGNIDNLWVLSKKICHLGIALSHMLVSSVALRAMLCVMKTNSLIPLHRLWHFGSELTVEPINLFCGNMLLDVAY